MPDSGNRQRRLDLDRLLVAVDRHAVMPGALGQLADLDQHRLARIADDEPRDLLERLERELVHHLDQTPAAGLVAGGERMQVALHLDRLAHVGLDDGEQVLVERCPPRPAA